VEINKVFKEIDMKDGTENGYIRFEDLDLAMRKFGVQPNIAEIEDIENKFKLDAKRNVNLEDFTKIMAKKLNEDMSRNDLARAFKLIDTDKSGFLDLKEFEELLRNIGINYSEHEIKKMVDQADADGSGQIDEDEFIDLMTSKAKDVKKGEKDYMVIMRDNIKRFIRK
jgi:Ca2+-binding EF-hand superfamily protein